jgi:hypothetical protein
LLLNRRSARNFLLCMGLFLQILGPRSRVTSRGYNVRDGVVPALEHRLGRPQPLAGHHPMVSNNGNCYIAGNTRSFAPDRLRGPRAPLRRARLRGHLAGRATDLPPCVSLVRPSHSLQEGYAAEWRHYSAALRSTRSCGRVPRIALSWVSTRVLR